MGTNYYLSSEPCPHCGRRQPVRHIGKSSAGWCFALHVYQDEGIKDLADWDVLFSQEGAVISSDHGVTLTRDQMIAVITERKWERDAYWTTEKYRENCAQRGPNGLTRSIVDYVLCIGHGEGTWDLCVGDFS